MFCLLLCDFLSHPDDSTSNIKSLNRLQVFLYFFFLARADYLSYSNLLKLPFARSTLICCIGSCHTGHTHSRSHTAAIESLWKKRLRQEAQLKPD